MSEAWVVAVGTSAGMAIAALFDRLFGSSFFYAAAFGVVAIVLLVFGLTRKTS